MLCLPCSGTGEERPFRPQPSSNPRPPGAAQRFDYSPALRALARRRPRWDEALLDRYIADPEAVAPKTSMTFTGMRDPRERADLIAYLRNAHRTTGARGRSRARRGAS